MDFNAEDVKKLAEHVIDTSNYTYFDCSGDYIPGYYCNHCGGNLKSVFGHDRPLLKDFKHKKDCVVLKAQDCLTGLYVYNRLIDISYPYEDEFKTFNLLYFYNNNGKQVSSRSKYHIPGKHFRCSNCNSTKFYLPWEDDPDTFRRGKIECRSCNYTVKVGVE